MVNTVCYLILPSSARSEICIQWEIMCGTLTFKIIMQKAIGGWGAGLAVSAVLLCTALCILQGWLRRSSGRHESWALPRCYPSLEEQIVLHSISEVASKVLSGRFHSLSLLSAPLLRQITVKLDTFATREHCWHSNCHPSFSNSCFPLIWHLACPVLQGFFTSHIETFAFVRLHRADDGLDWKLLRHLWITAVLTST